MRRMKLTTVIAASLLVAIACSKKESTKSKPVTCEVAGQMVAKRLGEFADQAKVTGERRAKLDKDMAGAIGARCKEDAWDEVPLGCLGAMANIPEGKVDTETYNKGIDICTQAIGKEKWKKMEDDVGVIVRSLKQ